MPSRMVLSPSEIRISQKLLKIPLSALVVALRVYIASENLSAKPSIKNHKRADNKLLQFSSQFPFHSGKRKHQKYEK